MVLSGCRRKLLKYTYLTLERALLSFTFRSCFLAGSWVLARLVLCCHLPFSEHRAYTILLSTWHADASWACKLAFKTERRTSSAQLGKYAPIKQRNKLANTHTQSYPKIAYGSSQLGLYFMPLGCHMFF